MLANPRPFSQLSARKISLAFSAAPSELGLFKPYHLAVDGAAISVVHNRGENVSMEPRENGPAYSIHHGRDAHCSGGPSHSVF
jgi:hypothetical protein